jgi:hypothetical protein
MPGFRCRLAEAPAGSLSPGPHLSRQICTNRYRGGYTAPAGAQVSLGVTVRDTHGASVTETIPGAYQTV